VTGEQVGPAADVFALGLVLLESLTGARGYSGSAMETAMARLHAAPSIPAEVEPGWRSLITRMTRREPGDRPSAAEVAALLADPDWADSHADAGRDLLDRTGELELTQDASYAVPRLDAHADRAPDAATAVAAGGTPRRRWAAGVLAAVVLLAVVVLLVTSPWKGSSNGGSGSEVPAGVPSRLQQPLVDLHDAVEGHR
jgi:hypothetical protein